MYCIRIQLYGLASYSNLFIVYRFSFHNLGSRFSSVFAGNSIRFLYKLLLDHEELGRVRSTLQLETRDGDVHHYYVVCLYMNILMYIR